MMKNRLSVIAVVALLLLMAACNKTDTGETTTDGGSTASGTTGGSAAGGATAGGSGSAAMTWGNAPDFDYITFAGVESKLSQNFGKPIVVNFWAMF